jgi:3-oxoacyl-[acyl-carrier protein] reductase
MDLGLSGLRALTLGSSRGLGYATARILALEGCRVVVNSRHPDHVRSAVDQINREAPGLAFGVPGDVALADQPANIVKEAAEILGGLDILITNSGGPPSGKFEQFNDEDWLQAVNLNLLSHVRLIRAALPYLRQSQNASVLTVTSYSVKQPIPNLVLSNSIRAATVGLTKTLALELGGDGIRFNSILPAWTQTERVTELMNARARSNQSSIEHELAKQAAESPFGRMATPEEFAQAAAFLVSPAASYITGVMLSVDGGMYKGTL